MSYVKKQPRIADIMAEAECGCPYPGAKEAYVLDITDSRKTLKVVISKLSENTYMP